METKKTRNLYIIFTNNEFRNAIHEPAHACYEDEVDSYFCNEFARYAEQCPHTEIKKVKTDITDNSEIVTLLLYKEKKTNWVDIVDLSAKEAKIQEMYEKLKATLMTDNYEFYIMKLLVR